MSEEKKTVEGKSLLATIRDWVVGKLSKKADVDEAVLIEDAVDFTCTLDEE